MTTISDLVELATNATNTKTELNEWHSVFCEVAHKLALKAKYKLLMAVNEYNTTSKNAIFILVSDGVFSIVWHESKQLVQV